MNDDGLNICDCPGCQNMREMIANAIQRHGFTVIGNNSDDSPVPYFYTVGFSEQQLPEILIFGISAEKAAGLIPTMFNWMKENGAPTDGQLVGDFSHQPISFRTVPLKSQGPFLKSLHTYYRREVPVMQVIVADPDSRFPWDSGVKAWVSEPQCVAVDWTVMPPNGRPVGARYLH